MMLRYIILLSFFGLLHAQGYLYFGDINTQEGTIDVWIECTDSLAGFQFDIFGVELLDAYGGMAEEYDFTIYNNDFRVLAFYFETMESIPPGIYLLVQLSYNTENVEYEICIDNIVLSDPYAVEIPSSSGECFNFVIDINVEYLNGWNIVGLPCLMDDTYYENLFNDVIPNSLYSFSSENGYLVEDTLNNGFGYLLRFSDDGYVTHSGEIIDMLTIPVNAGWNLISGISYSLPSEDIYSEPIIENNTLYGYNGNYYQAESLQPGIGYWIRASGSGEITLPSIGARSKFISFTNRLQNANKISISNGDHSSMLYFGKDVPEGEELNYSLPPVFQQMEFDARFAGNMRYMKEQGEIHIINKNKDLTVNYVINIHPEVYMEWVLTTENGEEYILTGTDEIALDQGTDRMSLTKRAIIPDIYALHQNYPNPFNPVTTLSYDLPEKAQVTLIIYDLMGREVTQLINTTQESGYKSVQWNATDMQGKPVSAGVYLYQIRAVEFVQIRKMILLK